MLSLVDGNPKQLPPEFFFEKLQVTVKVVDFGCAGPLSSERGVEAPWCCEQEYQAGWWYIYLYYHGCDRV